MFKITRLVRLTSGIGESPVEPFMAHLRESLVGAELCIVEPTLPGSRNGGDIMVHAQFRDEAAWAAVESRLDEVLAAEQVNHVDGVDYEAGAAPPPTAPSSVYRTLLLAVAPATPAAIVAEFESDLLLMPRFVHTITTFQLSRPTRTLGTSRWTHIFEQQFTDEAGLMGPYLMHPIHWARVDRWFDPECPEFIVQERICHSCCRSDEPVLASPPG